MGRGGSRRQFVHEGLGYTTRHDTTRRDTRHHTTSNEWQVQRERDESSTQTTGARIVAHLVTVTQAGAHRPHRIPCAQHRKLDGV